MEKIRTDCYVNGKSAEMMGLKDAERKNIARAFSLKDFSVGSFFVLNMRDAISFKKLGSFVPLEKIFFHGGFQLETFKEQVEGLKCEKNFKSWRNFYLFPDLPLQILLTESLF